MQARQLLVRGSAAVLGTGGVAFLAGYNIDEGFRRLVQFNYHVLPIALHYKAVEVLGRGQDGWFAQLHARYAPMALDIVLRQKGFYIKTAQFLSQYPDAIPREYVEAFKILRDDAPALPFSLVRCVVEKDLGLPLTEVFSWFDEEPLGAASIGQVHAANLLDGTPVVVKVQNPDAEKQFHIDMSLFIRSSAVLASYYVDIFKQTQKTFANEFDYRREAKLQTEVLCNLKNLPDIVVPEPFDDQHPKCKALFGRGLVTKNVFVMERLHGRSVDKWCEDMLLDIAEKKGVHVDQIREELRSMSFAELERLVPSDLAIRSYSLALGIQDMVRNTMAFAYNWSIGLIGAPIKYEHRPRPLNVHYVIDRLFKVQAKCLFEDGVFNGDPHAGNILLLNDGRIGLIDWGQVARFNDEQRLHFAEAIVTVAARDEPRMAELAWEMGVRTERQCPWVAMKLAMFWLGSFNEDVTGELGGPTAFDINLARIDSLVNTGGEYFAAVRCLMLTRGVVALMGFPAADSSVFMRPAAEKALFQAGRAVKLEPGRKVPRPDVEGILGFDFRKK